MMRMFRRHGPSDEECRIYRIRPQGSAEWQYITEPADGVVIKITDLMLLAEEVQKFEDERDLLRRPAGSAGSAPRYDWEGMNIMLFRRINDQGVPATQAELIAEVQDWFAQNSPNGRDPRGKHDAQEDRADLAGAARTGVTNGRSAIRRFSVPDRHHAPAAGGAGRCWRRH
jgi:hypothetical protein